LFDYLTSAWGSIEQERGELHPVVTLVEILIILVGIFAALVLLMNRKKK
jgi:hypothetical protein